MALTIYSVQLPTEVEAGSKFTLSDMTDQNPGDSGYIDPVRRFPHGKRGWQLVFGNRITVNDVAAVEQMFDVLGQSGGFLFWPPSPRHRLATDQVLPKIGATNSYQLRATSSLGGGVTEIYRSILYPRTDGVYAPVVKANGVTKTLTTDYTIESGGVVLFVASQGAAVITSTFYYYTPCIFVSDSLETELSRDATQILEKVSSINIEEVFVVGAV